MALVTASNQDEEKEGRGGAAERGTERQRRRHLCTRSAGRHFEPL